MNPLPEDRNGSDVPFLEIRTPPGFDACWAGPSVLPKGFGFGSVDGLVLFTDEEGALLASGKGSASGEAINGMARVDAWAAVSTRQEVNFSPVIPGTGAGTLALPHGAHGVTASRSGHFLAPFGRNGVMAARPPLTAGNAVTIFSTGGEGLYAYRVSSLHSEAAGDVLAVALRLGGVAAGRFSASDRRNTLRTATFAALDVVDICPLDLSDAPLAAALLSRDGTLVLFRDVVQDTNPVTVKFRKVRGVGYRLLSCRGDVYVLTSKGVFVLGKLAERFIKRELNSETVTPILPLSMEAVDMNVVGDRWLLAVLPGAVRRFDVDLIYNSVPAHIAEGEEHEFQATILSPSWQWGGVQSEAQSARVG